MQLLISIVIILIGTSSCSDAEKLFFLEEKPLPPKQDLSHYDEQAESFEGRLVGEFLENGYVVSRSHEGEARHVGDALLWSGIALGALPCEEAAEIFAAIEKSSVTHNGAFLRYDPLPAEYENDPTSRDMEVGALLGLVFYFGKCRNQSAIKLLDLHYDFIRSNNGRLFDGGDDSKVSINPAFGFFLNAISHRMLGSPKPPTQDLTVFESGALMTALSVLTARDPCYPVHLSTLQFISLAAVGLPVSQVTRKAFCEITVSMKLPLTDWYCERLAVENFLAEYQLNEGEYRHQRCGAWENLDDSDYQSPALDWIFLYRLAQGDLINLDSP